MCWSFPASAHFLFFRTPIKCPSKSPYSEDREISCILRNENLKRRTSMNTARESVKSPLTERTYGEEARLCPQCGKVVKLHTKHKKKFCSDRCRIDYWNSHQEQVHRKAYYSFECLNCGQSFKCYGNARRKYCSRRCYESYRRKRAESRCSSWWA